MGKMKDAYMEKQAGLGVGTVLNTKSAKKSKKSEKLPPAKGMTQLEAIEVITKLMYESELSEARIKKAMPYVHVVSKKQGLTETETLFLAVIVNMTAGGGSVDYSDISRFLSVNMITILKYSEAIDTLVKRMFIHQLSRRDDRYNFCVHKKFITALTKNEKYVKPTYKAKDVTELFYKWGELYAAVAGNRLPLNLFHEEAGRFFDENEGSSIVTEICKMTTDNAHELCIEDGSVLMTMAYYLYDRDCKEVGPNELAYVVTDDDYSMKVFARQFQENDNPFIKRKIVKFAFNDGFQDKSHWVLTAQTVKKIFKGIKLKKDTSLRDSDDMELIRPKDIKEKELFYPEKVVDKIDELTGLLDDKQYKKIIERLKQEKMRSGFTAIFYGSPGTGKTETALQLAKKTGRAIMQVNISEIKSMWVGESEKNIQRLFDQYRMYVKNSKVAPILLFNEADALINKRYTGSDQRAVEKMENGIAAIILNQMETLSGIMIATTNLETNLDPAHERRFLYKIKFEKPDTDARAKIWKSMLSVLTDDESRKLSEKYDFSGGQIENIARRYSIEKVLHGEPENRLERLITFCDDEKFEKEQKKKIGFL